MVAAARRRVAARRAPARWTCARGRALRELAHDRRVPRGIRGVRRRGGYGGDMANIAVLGGGHVGLVHGAGLAELGHNVRIIDVDRDKVRRLRAGEVFFYEPGLADVVQRNVERRRLIFTTSYADGVAGAEFIFMCLPTPTGIGGDLDVNALRFALSRIRKHIRQPAPILVNKSTVPVGTAEVARALLADARVPVVAHPEFLAEGRAVDDFFHPSRIVLGSSDRRAAESVARLYRALGAPVVITDSATA